ncbi:MAG: glycoside hydrolase family 5 protein [Oscillospiraceae bacterium]|nr:glycoside hydrolase family 5 protein [Oscillospiraceae bacterium]
MVTMKLIRRLGAVLAASALLLGAGCRKDSSSVSGGTEKPALPEFTIPENVLGTPSPLVPAEVSVDHYAVPERENVQFIKNLKLGWNLGNAFDAYDVPGLSDEMKYEGAWCGAVTKPENIAAIKAAGFRTVRIPVSWHNHVDADNRISAQWMARVKEVADWCRACDLYVIINTHHDVGSEGYYPDTANLGRSRQFLGAVWQQIAETFRDYDEHLILESLNEPRLVDSKFEWWLDKNSAECQDAVRCINELNQLFVDTVRGAGGNNETRYLLCPGYAASAEGALNPGFQLPDDPANRVIVSVHAYTPYDFALNAAGTKDFSLNSGADVNQITSFMDELYATFVMNGIPVLIGEFGARNKENLEARVQFSAFYVAAARARGISCCWWDNNAFLGTGENFGLLARGDSIFMYPEIVQALVKYCE